MSRSIVPEGTLEWAQTEDPMKVLDLVIELSGMIADLVYLISDYAETEAQEQEFQSALSQHQEELKVLKTGLSTRFARFA